MAWNVRWFIIFLIVNALLTVAYLVIALFHNKSNRTLAWLRAIVMFLVPGAGALLMILGWFGYTTIFRRDVDLSDVIFSKDREKELVRTNEESERNVVPLEEAIEITSKSELRSLVMNVAQGDYQQSLSAISLALNSEDSETAHYAASVLQDALNDYRVKVQKGYSKVKAKDDDLVETACQLMTYMNKVLVQNVFSEVEQEAFVNILEDVASILYEQHPESFTSDLYECVCLRLLEVKKYEKCDIWCKRGLEKFPNTLSSHTCIIKYYFNSNQKDSFFDALNTLKQSSIIIDKETLELIRAFQ